MTSKSDIARAAQELIAAISSADMKSIHTATLNIRKQNPFLYAAFKDTLAAAEKTASNKRSSTEFAEVVRVRAEALHNWQVDDNETIAAIQSGAIDADAIKPHLRFPSSDYEQFYAKQSDGIRQKSAASTKPTVESDYNSLPLSPNVNHAFRLSHAVTMVETVLGISTRIPRDAGPIRWMDIGCGSGEIANGVNPRLHGATTWEIIGCDLQEGKIELANRRKTSGRTFLARDAFALLGAYKGRGETFDLVTMFEFLEHLDDPLRLILQLNVFQPKFVLAGSPLEQKFKTSRDITPDPVHLWSFSRRAWEQMFALAGFEVVYSSEARVGTYLGGLDWLSVLCGPRDYLRLHRQSLRLA